MKLLPKTDGYTTMVFVFYIRSFVFGLLLSDVELRIVAKRRASCERGKYISNKEAIKINGTDEKRPLKENIKLVSFLKWVLMRRATRFTTR